MPAQRGIRIGSAAAGAIARLAAIGALAIFSVSTPMAAQQSCREPDDGLAELLSSRAMPDGGGGQLDAIVARLQGGLGDPYLALGVVVLDDDRFGAFATPCGQVLITYGMVAWLRTLAAERATSPADQTALADGYLASVLAHEAAHVSLGHTDEARIHGLLWMREATTTASSIGEAQESGAARASQERELAADRAAGLTLLRSGWEIRHAIDVFRALDELARSDPSASCLYCLEATSYLNSHPRSSIREAELEAFRAELKQHQARYDDALALILHNTELELAIQLLDEVLEDFPDLTAARHARTTALHLQWLQTVPVQLQRVRASLPTYSAYFLPGIRGGSGVPGNVEQYERAWAGYVDLLERRDVAYGRSALAVLEAYAGDRDAAVEGARHAARLRPSDIYMLNNLGVVHYLTGDLESARETFLAALDQPGGRSYTPLLFNAGATLFELEDARAAEYLHEYLAYDSNSGWGREAKLMAPTRGDASSVDADVEPPPVVGIRLSDPPDSVLQTLRRQPDETRDAGLELLWHYKDEGVLVGIERGRGVSTVVVRESGLPAVFGVEVGAAVETLVDQVTESWSGARSAEDFGHSDRERVWYFLPEADVDWMLTAATRDGKITSVCLTYLQ